MHCVQSWVRVDTEGSDSKVLEDIEEKEDEREVAVKSDQRDTPMHATTREDINALLADGYEVDDD